MGLGEFRDKFVADLSTGSRRIVDLACQVGAQPAVILLDEPSAGIAQRETEALAPVLLRLRDVTGASLLVIEHDLPLIMSVSDRIVALDVGRVVCEGGAERVVNDPQVIESYLGANWNLTGSLAARRPRRSGVRLTRSARVALELLRVGGLVHGLAAVDHELLAGEVPRFVGREEEHEVADVDGLAEVRQQDVAGEHRPLLRRQVGVGRGREDEAGHDRVDADAVTPVLRGDGTRERVETGLRRGVRGEVEVAELRRARRHVDDRPATLLAHHRDRVLAAEHRAAQVDGHDPLPGVDLHVGDGPVLRELRRFRERGVVVEDVEAPELADGHARPSPPPAPRR